MPITPRFSLSQSLTDVTVDIRVPHVRVSVQSIEVVVDGATLHFSSPPYLLVLTFPASLKHDEADCAIYDPSREGGTVTLKAAKQEPAIWPDLDLMGALLNPTKQTTRCPAIQVLDKSPPPQERDDTTEGVEEDLADLYNVLRPHYGFLNLFSGIFTDLARDGLAAEMLELPNPDTTSAAERRQLRLAAEDCIFDAERYIGDLDAEDDYIYQTAMSVAPHWRHHDDVEELVQRLSDLATDDTATPSYFTPEEMAQLASIPYPLLPDNISAEQEDSLLLGLLDILFAYVYDHLTTGGDPTIESSWTICILSPTLSWLDMYESPHDTVELVVKHSIRRSLMFPYLRNYQLSLHCWKNVEAILKDGRRCVMRCLLQTRAILDKSESHYLGNKLYIDPYLAWIQRHVTHTQLGGLNCQLNTLDIQKASLGLNLVTWERWLHENDVEQSDESSERDDDSTQDEASNESSTSSSKESEESELSSKRKARSKISPPFVVEDAELAGNAYTAATTTRRLTEEM